MSEQIPMPWGENDGEVGISEPFGSLSPDRRRTIRQRSRIAAGWHPLMKSKLDPDLDHRCGNCAALRKHRRSRGYYYKCAHLGGGSPATDVRLKWPGCRGWEPHP